LVTLEEATFVGFSTDEHFADDAQGAALLAERLAQLRLGEPLLLVVPARLSPPASSWLARFGRRDGRNASKALRCTALRLAGYDIVQVIDESGNDAIIARRQASD
jgi:hypothetical protein